MKLEIYNMMGRNMLTLTDENQTAGDHEITWDGRDRNSVSAPSGMYIVRMTQRQAAGITSSRTRCSCCNKKPGDRIPVIFIEAVPLRRDGLFFP